MSTGSGHSCAVVLPKFPVKLCLSNTNFIASRHIKRDKFSLLFDVHLSKMSLLKLDPYCCRGGTI